MTPVKFYILQSGQSANSVSSSSDQAGLLTFICKLTHKVQTSSAERLVIVDDDVDRLTTLNDSLWSFSPTSFVPHELFIEHKMPSLEKSVNDAGIHDTAIHEYNHIESRWEEYAVKQLSVKDLTAPVTLVNKLPDGFNGIVLNLTQSPIKLGNACQILEVISSDAKTTQSGRDKVRHYRKLHTDVGFFKVRV